VKRYADNPLTPNMQAALLFLVHMPPGAHDVTVAGRPTRQRLAKFGYAEFVAPDDPVDRLLCHKGDWPMRITEAGRKAVDDVPSHRLHRWTDDGGSTCGACGLHREGAGAGPYGAMRYYRDDARTTYDYKAGPCHGAPPATAPEATP
jgi:hypothetical protein